MQPFREIVERRLRALGGGAVRAATSAGLKRDSIRSVLRGRVPSIDRAAEICSALGLEFYIGPPRGKVESVNTPGDSQIEAQLSELERHTQGLVRAVAAAGGDPIPADLRAALLAERPPRGARGGRPTGQVRETASAPSSDFVPIPFARDVRLAAGPGEPVWDETEEMAVSVARAALPPWARPERLRCARVAGDSMTPTVGDGDLAAIDQGREEPLDGQLFALRTDAGVAVKRLRRIAGRWHMVSDNPAYEPRPVTRTDRILGQVAWTGPPAARS